MFRRILDRYKERKQTEAMQNMLSELQSVGASSSELQSVGASSSELQLMEKAIREYLLASKRVEASKKIPVNNERDAEWCRKEVAVKELRQKVVKELHQQTLAEATSRAKF